MTFLMALLSPRMSAQVYFAVKLQFFRAEEILVLMFCSVLMSRKMVTAPFF